MHNAVAQTGFGIASSQLMLSGYQGGVQTEFARSNNGKPDLSFSVRDKADALFINGNHSFRGGNVGIGTTAPEAKLHVSGDLRVAEQRSPGVLSGMRRSTAGMTHPSDSATMELLPLVRAPKLRPGICGKSTAFEELGIGTTRPGL